MESVILLVLLLCEITYVFSCNRKTIYRVLHNYDNITIADSNIGTVH